MKVLYVKNLKSLVSEDELRKVFEPYGTVGRVKKTKDYGFIHFENREDALRAMDELNGTVCGLVVSFCADTSAQIQLFVYQIATQKQQSLNGLFSRTARVGWYQKDKPF